METDARGQLGGLDTTDAVRRRLATESHTYRCPACARTNAEIIAECEEAAKAHGGEGSAAAEVEVPAELKMGFRDEMEAAAKAAAATAGGGVKPDVDSESAELAEGFVQTAPLLPPETESATASAAEGTATTSTLRARPAPGEEVPQPTRTVPLPDPNVNPQPQQQLLQRAGVSNHGVPVWIDRLILVVGILLATMLLKVFLA